MFIPILFVIIASLAASDAADLVEIGILNNYDQDFWLANQGYNGNQCIDNGGTIIKKKQSISYNVPAGWSGSFWARTGCNSKTQKCSTGDCGKGLKCNGNGSQGPCTLIEVNLGTGTVLDLINISLLNGFNIAASVGSLLDVSIGGSSCNTRTCSNTNLNKCLKVDLLGILGLNLGCAGNTNYLKQNCPDACCSVSDYDSCRSSCNSNKYLIVFG